MFTDKPFLELLWGDQACSEVGVSNTLCLPPCRIILAYNFQDVSSLKRQTSLLAGNGSVFFGIIAEKGPHKHLQKKVTYPFFLSYLEFQTTVRRHSPNTSSARKLYALNLSFMPCATQKYWIPASCTCISTYSPIQKNKLTFKHLPSHYVLAHHGTWDSRVKVPSKHISQST